MNDQPARSQGFNVMLTLASFVVVVAGMKAATSILIPFLLSVFIAIVSGPALFGLKRVGVPTPIALLVVILVVILVGILVIGLVGNSITDFTKALPGYQERLEGVGVKVIDWLNENLSRFDIEIPTIRDTPEASSGLLPPDTSILGADGTGSDLSEGTVGGAKNPFDAGFVMRLVGGMLSSLGAVLTNAFLILLTVIFILL
ncbi:MAG: AI-2E family transporter, partial [Candidatus Omnitrophica bacterium]|nr:AI-2E family transporter [Candidatus Omnitrophota bacterium]